MKKQTPIICFIIFTVLGINRAALGQDEKPLLTPTFEGRMSQQIYNDIETAPVVPKNEFMPTRNPFVSQLPKPAAPPQQPMSPIGFPAAQEEQEVKSDALPKILPVFNITGLVWNTDRPQAIIDDQVVDVGDTVKDSQIIAIHKTGIEVLINGEVVTINAGKEKQSDITGTP